MNVLLLVISFVRCLLNSDSKMNVYEILVDTFPVDTKNKIKIIT